MQTHSSLCERSKQYSTESHLHPEHFNRKQESYREDNIVDLQVLILGGRSVEEVTDCNLATWFDYFPSPHTTFISYPYSRTILLY